MGKFLYHIFVILLFGFLWIPLHPQINFPLNQHLADSLESLLPSASGKEKVDILNGISYALIRHYSSKSDSLSSISVQLAKEINYKEGLAKALFCKGTNDYINGNFIEGLDLLYDAVDLYKAMADTAMIIDTYYQIAGVSYFSLTDLKEGIRLVSECLRYSSESGDKLREAQMYSTLQYLYATAGDGDRALHYMDLYEKTASKISPPRIEKAMVTAAWGRDYALKADFKKAIPFYFSALQMVNPDDIEERSYLAQLCNFIGDAYLNLGRPDSAMVFFQKGMKLSRKHQIYYGSIINALGLARLYLKENDFLQSELYCDSVIYFGEKIDSSGSFYGIAKYSKLLGMSGEHYIPMNNEFKRFLAWRIMAGAYQILMHISELQEEYRNALQINIQLNEINDSIANFQKRTEILDILHKYQAEQKDDEITLLSQENQIQSYKIGRSRLILFSVIAISILLLFILILVLRQNRIKSERKVAEFKQRLLRSQMNPHFIFNSLTSVQNFILQHDDIKASVYLSRFSDLVRNILSNSLVELITLEEEINTIENYLELQKIRFPEKFEYSINMDESLNPESIALPPMLTQPFIENAIEHGFKHIEHKGQIDINFINNSDHVVIHISDNGIGRQKSHEMKSQQEKDHPSMATLITTERIRTINKKLKKKIHFEIIDLKDKKGKGTGTKVIFKTPVLIKAF
jgi:sensor histidine kinase YesM